MDAIAAADLGVMEGTTINVDALSAFPVAGQTGIAQGQGVGQHGVSPMTGELTGSVAGGVESVWDWLNTPFKNALSPVTVFMLVGIVIVAALVWNLVLYHIRIAAEAI
jgi:hypothetical protein